MGIVRDVLDLMFRRVLPVPMTRWQVENRLASMAAVRGEKLDWRNSVVDLLKLLGADSSLAARRDLARQLGYGGALDGSAAMNQWLHGKIMDNLAAHDGVFRI